jgi:Predicted metal binding domain
VEYKEPIQFADPEVTRLKFDNELNKFLAVEEFYNKKGILCCKVDYPSIYFIFGVPKLIPIPLVFSVRINFTNYDVEPPAVAFINPFTDEVLKREQIPIAFVQFNPGNPFQPQDLLQGIGDIVPFFCIPGIKEYHDHPAHSGDPWFLYRTKGEGSLLFILDQLYNSSIPSAKEYNLNVNVPTIRINQEIIFQQMGK